MQKLILFTSAAVIGLVAYIGLQSDEKETIVESKPTTSNEVLVSAVEEIEKQNKSKEILNIAATEVVKKSNAKNIQKKKALKKVVAKKAKKTLPKVIEDKVQTQAAAPMTTTIVTEVKKKKNKWNDKKVSGYVQAGTRTDFKEAEDDSKMYGSDYEISIGYRLAKDERISYWLPMSKDLSDTYEEKLSDSKIGFSKSGIYKNGNFIFQASTSLVVPSSKKSKVKDEMYTALELNPQFIYKLDNIFTAGSMFRYIPRYKRAFHKYEFDRDGGNLVEQSIVQFYVLTIPMNDKWTFESTLVYVMGRGYNGRDRNHSYLTVQEIGYNITKRLSWLSGIETGGSLVDPERGESETVEVFDAETSEFYTALNLAF